MDRQGNSMSGPPVLNIVLETNEGDAERKCFARACGQIRDPEMHQGIALLYDFH